MDYDEQFDDNEWTPEEIAQFRALHVERAPTATLKARTVGALRREHLIGARWSPGARTVIALAAASVVFAAGTVVGYAAGSRGATSQEPPAPAASAVARVDSTGIAQHQTRQVIWF
jgi:hypothetical protein